jgi:hypothetical protein
MKLFTLFLAILFFTGFTSCVDRMDINDVKDGTPTRIDTILTNKYAPALNKDSSKENMPAVESEK